MDENYGRKIYKLLVGGFVVIGVVAVIGAIWYFNTNAGEGSSSSTPVVAPKPVATGDLKEAYRILEAGYTSWGYWGDKERVALTAKLLLTDSNLNQACKDPVAFEAGFTPAFVKSFNTANPDVHEPSWANPDLTETEVSPVILKVLAAACPP